MGIQHRKAATGWYWPLLSGIVSILLAGSLLAPVDARAETEWAFIDYALQRPVRVPPEVASSFPVVGEEAHL